MPNWFNTRSFRILLLSVAASLLLPSAVFANTLKVGGTGAALGAMRTIAKAYSALHPDISVLVPPSLGSGGGIRAVTSGALDIGLSTRPLKIQEIDKGAKQLAYARSPFALVTSYKGSGPGLTSAQVIEIFTGKRSQWEDGTSIRIILRPYDDSDTQLLITTFKGIGPAIATARATPGIPTAATDQSALDKAESIPGSFTTATLTAIVTEGRSVKPISIDGVAPTLENLINGAYPIAKKFYLITGPKLSQPAKEFIRFIRSKEGADILRKTGNLPL